MWYTSKDDSHTAFSLEFAFVVGCCFASQGFLHIHGADVVLRPGSRILEAKCLASDIGYVRLSSGIPVEVPVWEETSVLFHVAVLD